jgi:hypothetical protein
MTKLQTLDPLQLYIPEERCIDKVYAFLWH